MAVETTDYLAGLDPAAPGRAAPKREGDDHIRLTKKALRQSFPGFTGAIVLGGTSTGAADNYVLTPAAGLVSYVKNMGVLWFPSASNLTTAPTLNVSGLGAKAIKAVDGSALTVGDIIADQPIAMVYDGTQFRLTAPTINYVNQRALSAALPGQSLGWLGSDATTAAFTQTHTGYAQKEVRGTDIASASTVNLTGATGNLVHITGSQPIDNITIPVGAAYTLVFDGVCTLTHSAGLQLPNATNITTDPGGRIRMRGDTPGAVAESQYVSALAPTPPDVVTTGYFKASERYGSGATPGSATPASIAQTRRLNTVEVNTIAGASLTSFQVTLPAGTYEFFGSAPAYQAGRTKAFLYNVTDNTYPGIGISTVAGGLEHSYNTVYGRVTISAPKVFTLRHYTQNAQGNSNDLGDYAGTGQPEVYAELEIRKVVP